MTEENMGGDNPVPGPALAGAYGAAKGKGANHSTRRKTMSQRGTVIRQNVSAPELSTERKGKNIGKRCSPPSSQRLFNKRRDWPERRGTREKASHGEA